MDIIKISNEIEKKIKELELAKSQLKDRTNRKAEANANYDRSLAVTMLKLKNRMIHEFENNTIMEIPATLVEKIAKGICYKERLEQEIADAEYRSLITYIETTSTQLNGWQSINKYLQEK